MIPATLRPIETGLPAVEKNRVKAAVHSTLVFLAVCSLLRAGFSLLQSGGSIQEGDVSASTHQSGLLTIFSYLWILLIPFAGAKYKKKVIYDTPSLHNPTIYALACSILLLISATWSPFPGTSLKEAIKFALIILLANKVTKQLTFSSFLNLMLGSFLAINIASILTSIFIPSYGMGIGVHSGAMTGVFNHKNALGRFAALSILISLFSLLSSAGLTKRAIANIALSCITLIGSHSANALVVAAANIIVVGLLVFSKRIHSPIGKLCLWYLSSALLATTITCALLFPDIAASTIGKTSNLSGRSEIWKIAVAGFWESPFFGHGVSAYWPLKKAVLFWGETYVVPHAHNGFLDILLDGGVTLLAVFIAYLVSIAHCIKNADGQLSQVGFCSLFFFLSFNIAESNLLKPTFYFFYIAVISIYLFESTLKVSPRHEEIRGQTV